MDSQEVGPARHFRVTTDWLIYFAAVSEDVPVLHIVGVPSTTQQKEKALVDHTLGDGRYG